MVINWNLLVPTVAFLGCAGLLVFWLLVSRKAFGFYLICTGWAAIIACVRSDRSLSQMLGILILTALVSGALLAGYGMLKARAARNHWRVYRPSAAQREALKVQKSWGRHLLATRRGRRV